MKHAADNGADAAQFAAHIAHEFNALMSCHVLLLGHRLGLLSSLAAQSPATAAELAEATRCDERYVREWLAACAAGGYIHYDAATDRFVLPPAHADVLANPDSPHYAIPSLLWGTRIAAVLPALETAFRTGVGVPYAAYDAGALDGAGDADRFEYLTGVADWLHGAPALSVCSQRARRVLDVACGHGWSTIALASALPQAAVEGLDADPASLAAALRNVARAGLTGRISLHQTPAEAFATSHQFDLITAFQCVHDMAHPVRVLERLRQLLAPGGILLVADVKMADDLEDNLTPLGHGHYNWSVLHCLPQARIAPDSAATGCGMGPMLLRSYAAQAGLRGFEILPIEHPMWYFYQLT